MSTLSTKEKAEINLLLEAHGKTLEDLKLGEAMLKDGSTLVFDGDTITENMPLLVKTPDGVFPAPDGVHELEDGTMVETMGGIVQSIKAPDVAPANSPDTPVTQDNMTPAQEQAVKRIIESVTKETQFTKEEVNELLEKQKTEYEAKFEEQKKTTMS